jgi:hypothetical protein
MKVINNPKLHVCSINISLISSKSDLAVLLIIIVSKEKECYPYSIFLCVCVYCFRVRLATHGLMPACVSCEMRVGSIMYVVNQWRVS